MIKNICCLILLGLSAACAGGDEELGTLQQGLTRPVGYGISHINALRCSSTSNCELPWDKTISYRFYASTCSAWWQARWVTAVNDWIGIMSGLGWNIQFNNTPDYELRCYDVAGSNSGEFVSDEFVFSDHYRFNTGEVRIDPAQIELNSGWGTHTDVQRQRFAVNSILHELGHSVGLGHHSNADADPTVTGGPSYQSVFWTTFPGFSVFEHDMMSDYVP